MTANGALEGHARVELTEREIDAMEHALGMNQRKKVDRNYFAAQPGSVDHAQWMSLAGIGYARWYRTIDGLDYYTVTPAGKAALQFLQDTRRQEIKDNGRS